MEIKLIAFLFLISLSVSSQGKKWENDLVVNYKMTDSSGKMKNAIEVKKDTVQYEWREKGNTSKKLIIGDTALENKLVLIIEKSKFWKFKSAKILKPGPNIVFVYSKAKKNRTIIIPRNAKPGSKEAVFVKEFLEPILLKAFESEMKNFPR